MEGKTPRRFLHTHRESEIEAELKRELAEKRPDAEVLKRIHFELQEFFRTTDAGTIGFTAHAHLERARDLAAQAINKLEEGA